MAKAKNMIRVFRSGSVNLPDPDPNLAPEAVKEMYSVNYPHLANAIVENPDNPKIEGSKLVYVFAPPPAKTKG